MCWVGAADESIFVGHSRIGIQIMPQRRQDDFRREWQRGGYRPCGQRAVVGTIRHAARAVSEERTCDASDAQRLRPRTITSGDPPAVLAVPDKTPRVANRILPLHVGGPAAVLEV